MGTGEVKVATVLSSETSLGASMTVTETETVNLAPGTPYTPGMNPDIIALALGNNKYRESLTPVPRIFRDYLETRFDVVTYAKAGSDATFLRRDEFVAIACECTLQPASNDRQGRRPIVWAGDEYLEGNFVTKPYGEEVRVKQSPFCDICCRDHHDGGSGPEDPPDVTLAQYGPNRNAAEYWDSGRLRGDHKHYKRQRTVAGTTTLEVAQVGDDYVEACRLVRKNGFFQVAQDFRLEGLNIFPENYLVNSSQVNEYSNYVTQAVVDFVDNPGAGLAAPTTALAGDCPVVDASLSDGFTCLPTAAAEEAQQLRSRSIYVDYIGADLALVLSCIENAASQTEKLACQEGDVQLDKLTSVNTLELIPFFELQTTFLNEWEEEPIDHVATVTNEAIQTDNLHSRGWAERVETMDGRALATARGHRGVLGITATDPIDNRYLMESMEGEMNLLVGRAETGPNPTGRSVTGFIVSYVPGVQAANVALASTDASCNYAHPQFECLVPGASSEPFMVLDIMQSTPTNLVVCSNSASLPVEYVPSEWSTETIVDPVTGEVTTVQVVVGWDIVLDMSVASGSGHVIWLDVGSCG
jgi:hypothetical protein